MYAFFKRFKQFFVGVGITLIGLFAYLFHDSRRDRSVKANFDRLQLTVGELRKQLEYANELAGRLEQENIKLRNKFTDGTTELSDEIEFLRSENERIYTELSERVKEAGRVINKIDTTGKNINNDLRELTSTSNRLEEFIQKYGNTN